MSSGIIPGACAPSIMIRSTPRSLSARTIRSAGKTSPVWLVTWSKRAKRVRADARAAIASTISSAERSGNGASATTTVAPLRAAT